MRLGQPLLCQISMSDCSGDKFSSRKFFHVYYSPQRRPWGQKKVAIVERWPLWEGRGVIWQINYFLGVQHTYCAKFMLTVPHNGNPLIIYK